MNRKLLKYTCAMAMLVAFVMVTCRSNSVLSYRQIRTSLVDGKVKTFVQKIANTDGVYLMENDKKTIYLMLTKLKDDKTGIGRTYITNMVVKPVGDSITISYSESNHKSIYSKRFQSKLLYRIKLQKDFKSIKVFRNGKETHFNNVYL